MSSRLFAVVTALLVSTVLTAPTIASKDSNADFSIDFNKAISVVPANPAAGSSSAPPDYAHGYCTCK
jgi:hypothetical protein